jgi:hypothetical protein
MIAFFITILALLTGLPGLTSDPERIWHVKNESRLAISGESNINDFRCEVDRYYQADNLDLYSSSGEEFLFSRNQMIINLMEFDCGRALITRDFRQTLNADKDPAVIISFISLDRLPQDNVKGQILAGLLEVTIAGVSKEAEIQFSIRNNSNGTISLHGKHEFSFTDFGLEPPSKVMGLISVKNNLEVTFDLILEELPHTDLSGQIHGRN